MVERHGSVMNHNPNLTYLEKSIPEDKEPDHRMEQKHERKQPRVEEIPFVKKRLEEKKLKGRKPFDPFARIKVNYMLSLLNPQFYTEEELATIKEICQGCYQQSLSTSTNNKVEEGSMSKMNKSNKKSKKGEPTSLPPLVEPLPDLPVHVRNMIVNLNGTDVRFVMSKMLYNTDLKPNNNRLSMPQKEIKCDFLTEIEKAILDSKENGKPVGLEVTVLDPSFKEYTMQLKKWKCGHHMSTILLQIGNNYCWKTSCKKTTISTSGLLESMANYISHSTTRGKGLKLPHCLRLFEVE